MKKAASPLKELLLVIVAAGMLLQLAIPLYPCKEKSAIAQKGCCDSCSNPLACSCGGEGSENASGEEQLDLKTCSCWFSPIAPGSNPLSMPEPLFRINLNLEKNLNFNPLANYLSPEKGILWVIPPPKPSKDQSLSVLYCRFTV